MRCRLLATLLVLLAVSGCAEGIEPHDPSPPLAAEIDLVEATDVRTAEESIPSLDGERRDPVQLD